MKITPLILGVLDTNCYLVSDGAGNAAVIDPSAEPERILAAVREQGVQIRAILLTHGHFDHVGAVRPIAEATGCAVWLNALDCALPPDMTGGLLYYTDAYGEGDEVTVGELTFTVLHTPGHTPGSVCLRCENTLFSGDTLFAGSCGRIDFPGGRGDQMRESLDRLAAIPEDLTVLPGHGEGTTLEWERKYNPFMRRGSL